MDPIDNPFLSSTIIGSLAAISAIAVAVWILISWPAYWLLALLLCVIAIFLVLCVINPYP